MPENEYINLYRCRDDFYATILNILSEDSTNDRANQIIDAFDYLPTTDVVPVHHGYWICENLGFGAYRYRCSECGNIYGQDQIEDFKHNKFCGDCGAKMAEMK